MSPEQKIEVAEYLTELEALLRQAAMCKKKLAQYARRIYNE